MNRRSFIQKATFTTAALGLGSHLAFSNKKRNHNLGKILNAYYFRAHMYTLVPEQIRKDMEWMAKIGTTAVSVAILEQDLYAAVENIKIVCKEAQRLGMDVYGVPSRWGGLVAGAPKVPSMFTICNPETYILNKDGSPHYSSVSGRISSIHHPMTYDFWISTLDKMLKVFPLKGIVIDEPKVFIEDYSPMAIEVLGKDATPKDHYIATAKFFDKACAELKEKHPDVETHMFSYANAEDAIVEAIADMKHLDSFGCDGRPWGKMDGGVAEGSGKYLLDDEGGLRYLDAAKKRNKRSLWLIENHNLSTPDNALMDKGLPDILNLDVDHLIYYYYPRNLERPDEVMNTIKTHLKNYYTK